MFYALLSYDASREAILNWIALVLHHNDKRSMIDVELNLVACDHSFLNLVTVLHQLLLPIKIGEIDGYYPFHPQGRLAADVVNETYANCI